MNGSFLCVLYIIAISTSEASLTYEIDDATLDKISEKTFISAGERTKIDCDHDEKHLTKCFKTSTILNNVKNPYIGGNIILIENNGCTIATVFEMANCNSHSDTHSQKSCPKIAATNGHCYVSFINKSINTILYGAQQ